MKIVICDDHPNLQRDIPYEVRTLQEHLPDAEIEVYEYSENDPADFYRHISDADGIINTVCPMNEDTFSHAKKLKCLAQNGVGYNMVDVPAATAHGIMVCPASEYCTDEVAEHTMALILALRRGLRVFIADVENRIWDYRRAGVLKRLHGQTIAIFGYGKIGKAVAEHARAMGMQVLVVSQHLSAEGAVKDGVEVVSWEEAFERADVLSNHMPLRAQSEDYFNYEKFSHAKKAPLFINTGRGASVNEADLARALDEGLISGAGLDVLKSEIVDFDQVPFLGRSNVILTPHVAFYSGQSELDLQTMSCESVIFGLKGHPEKIARLLNKKELGIEV